MNVSSCNETKRVDDCQMDACRIEKGLELMILRNFSPTMEQQVGEVNIEVSMVCILSLIFYIANHACIGIITSTER